MRRGDVVSIDVTATPATAVTPDGERRPAVVVSNDGANRTARRLGRGAVTVVPITEPSAGTYPFQVLLPAGSCGMPQPSTAHAEQIQSVEIGRVGDVLGHVPDGLLGQVEEAIKVHLGLDSSVAS
jgi:mRNA interferase MazF